MSTKTPRRTIDLNADLGEGYAYDEALMQLVSSANVSTGVYTDAPAAPREALLLAKRYSVVVGCHPGYPDPGEFGRKSISWTLEEAFGSISEQVIAFRQLCEEVGIRCRYIKPHGALYHDAGQVVVIQKALGTVARLHQLPVLHYPDSPLARIVDAPAVFAEGFAERRYQEKGILVSRSTPNATIHDPIVASEQAVLLARGEPIPTRAGPQRMPVDSICVHGDAPAALDILKATRQGLENDGFAIASFL